MTDSIWRPNLTQNKRIISIYIQTELSPKSLLRKLWNKIVSKGLYGNSV